jgi:hypothetical protein
VATVKVTAGEIELDGRSVVRTPSFHETLQSASQLDEHNPFLLLEGDNVLLDLLAEQMPAVLSAIGPRDDLRERLADERDSEGSGSLRQGEWGIDKGNTVNGRSWSWVSPDDENWNLVPTQGGAVLASLGAWMSASMTGIVITGAVDRWGDGIGALWADDDIEGPRDGAVRYDVRDWSSVLREMTSWVFDDWAEPICPACDPDWAGWEITIDLDRGTFSEADLQHILGTVWRACSAHAAQEVELELPNGTTWRWHQSRWEPG